MASQDHNLSKEVLISIAIKNIMDFELETLTYLTMH